VRWSWKIAFRLAFAGIAASIGFRIAFACIGMPGYDRVEQNLLSGDVWLQILVLLAASPLLEEFFFRGIFYVRLKELVSAKAAMILSALAFGLYHANLSQGVYGFIMGIFLAWSMERYRTIKAPLIVHIGANFAAIMAENAKKWLFS